jgi:hypothetical protein
MIGDMLILSLALSSGAAGKSRVEQDDKGRR